MIGSLATLAIISTPVVGLIWIIFVIWEAFDRT